MRATAILATMILCGCGRLGPGAVSASYEDSNVLDTSSSPSSPSGPGESNMNRAARESRCSHGVYGAPGSSLYNSQCH